MPNTVKPKILLVDDEAAILEALQRTLQNEYEVCCSADPVMALEWLEREEFAALVSDMRMPSMAGTELLARAARSRPLTTRLILTAFTESGAIVDAINRAEIYRFIAKPWDNEELRAVLRQACEHHQLRKENDRLLQELKATNQSLEKQVAVRTEELRIANVKLSELALTDSLTRVANRRALFQRFQEEIDRAERYERPIAVAMVDVDHFKAFNDMEGHVCGDEALKKIAAALSSNVRKTDFLGRYGGEEFVVLMPETKISTALEISHRLRTAVENTVFQGRAKQAYLTVSLGIAGYPQNGQTPKALIESADQALYEAKQGGRNRIVVFE